VDKGDIFTGIIFFIIAEIGYRGGQVFYNFLLPEIASSDEIGRVSGNGWAIGSLRGILCLVIILPPIVMTDGTMMVPISLVFTALFFALSSIPAFLWINERAQQQKLPENANYLSLAIKLLAKTFRSVRHYREFIKFIVAILVYNDGILMALDFAVIIGAVLFVMNQQQQIIFVILVPAASIGSAYIFARVGGHIGFKHSLIS